MQKNDFLEIVPSGKGGMITLPLRSDLEPSQSQQQKTTQQNQSQQQRQIQNPPDDRELKKICDDFCHGSEV